MSENVINEHNKRLADYAFVFDVIGNITFAMSETTAIDNIIDLFRSLCAPLRIIYVSIKEDKPCEIRTFPATINKFIVTDLIMNFKEDYALTISGQGFRLRIKCCDTVFGIIEIDGITFPEYITHYLNLSLTIINILGLTISNARIYQELLISNDELKKEIDKRHIAENIIRREKDFTDTLINALTDTFFVFNVNDGKALRWNKVFSDVSGYNDDEIAVMKMPNSYYLGEDLKKFYLIIQDITKEGSAKFELSLITKTGKTIPTEYSASIVKDDDANPNIIVLIGRDITQRKILEETIRAEISEGIRKYKLQEQILIQQSKMASMGEIIGLIAHQWKQPLNAIFLHVQDLKDAYHYGELNEEYIKESTETIKQQIDFMSQTIDYFRNFLKPSNKKVVFSIKQAISELVDMFSEMYKKNNIKILLEDFSNPQITLSSIGYPNEFKQVLLNIINNSKDAIINRRVIDGHFFEGYIHILCSEEWDNICILIKDNGGGIKDDIMDKIFTPYFSTKKPDAGTGLGLYMSKTIIENNMGGKLIVKNVGEGAEFSIIMKKYTKE
ncbi:MAG: PAS domain-containing sensor histidine kinase [Candidatus Magnetoovum sp. WYHC-5]|nr:PAS domain-containing sensor histidine kinase [Candidatus Magnetoovum sp. WYHC-5]